LAPWRLALLEPSVHEIHTARDLHQFAAATTAFAPQVLIVQYAVLLPLLRALPPALRRGLRVVVDTHDVKSERRLRFHARGAVHDIKMSASEEALLLRRCDLVLAIQDEDRAKLQPLAGRVPVATMLHPVVIRQRATGAAALGRVLFLGSGMAPNQQAAAFLLDEVWPALQRRGLQAIPLTLAGSVCDALRGRVLPPGVVLAGQVPDVGDLYSTHAIVAAPLFAGGGLKIKVAEALGAGAAVLATPLAAEGLRDAVACGALQVADGAEGFAAALLGLLLEPARVAALGEAAARWAAAHLSPEVAFAPLDAFISSLPQPGVPAAAHTPVARATAR
jgi:glycosyltransferase involved in cell wall biosynthesis